MCCNRICVEDNELHEFYFDPKDPSANLNLWEDGLVCPICGHDDWSVSDRLGDLDGSEFENWPHLAKRSSEQADAGKPDPAAS